MIVRLEDIPPEGLEVEFDLDPSSTENPVPGAEGPVRASLRLEKIGSGVFVRGRVQGVFISQCARCLSPVVLDLREALELELRPAADMEGRAEMELKADDLDVEYYRGDILDLGHILAEQVALAMPMKPLCAAGCEGLCSRCGKPLGQGPCSCPADGPDPRWDALHALKEKLKKEE